MTTRFSSTKNTATPRNTRRSLGALARDIALVISAAGAIGTAQSATPLADKPLFSAANVPGNVAFALSVEWPTASRTAHPDAYSSANVYRGYFDHDKCYLYNYSATETDRHFYPAGKATNRTCTGTDDNKWSGNFLNWASTPAIDPFRSVMTGGYRVKDETSVTILQKAWHNNQGLFPDRALTATEIAGATPTAFAAFNIRIAGLGHMMRFTGTGSLTTTAIATSIAVAAPAAINVGSTADAFDATKVYEVSVRVKVCDSSASAGGLEANCKAYGSNYKPEGLIQKYAEKMRFSAFGYVNETGNQRDGGVMRARQKFVGPTETRPGLVSVANTAAEWDSATGVFYTNPDKTDADATMTEFGTGVSVVNSGVINYLNKFGQITPGNYKGSDPVGEMYYAALRYFRNLGNVPEWSSMGTATGATRNTRIDGFPVITTWDDPIKYSCQRNFVLGIGDIYTHADKNVPGNTNTANEPTMPPMVSGDTAVDAVAATNKLGKLQGMGDTLGTKTNISAGCCSNNSALMSGLAYLANTQDIRPDDSTKPQTAGKQTVQTYWVDVLEKPFVANNQFYLTAKYGGFKVPEGFDPYARETELPLQWWSTSGEKVGTQDRPDNYFTAGRPDTMQTGLTQAFAKIAEDMKAYTSSFSVATPQIAAAGNGSYSTLYDASNWTGEMIGSKLSFSSSTGLPQVEPVWTLSSKLATQAASTGWDTGRKIATWNTSTKAAVAFRLDQLSDTQKSALNTPYRGGDAGDFLNYLRGDRQHEQASTTTGSAKAYRTRAKLLGDIVGSKARPIGPPSMPYSNAANPGYAKFKSDWAARVTVVYFGANDGMMHAVNGSISGTADDGKEIFAYVPGALYAGPNSTPGVDGLAALGNPDFTHHYYVNATPNVYDIDLGKTVGGSGTDWRSVLIGGLGKGGRGYYAIDVTNPSAFTSETATAGKVMWEFTNADMGYSFGDPVIAKTRQHGWVAIFTSGYNNSDGKGYFFIVNPRTGALIQKIDTGAGSSSKPAGLAYATSYLLDKADGTADSVYAGDLLGNVWRLDLTAARGDYPAPVQLASLKDADDVPQPVTTRPTIGIQPGTLKRFVLIGTGRMLADSDIGDNQLHSFYAIIDGTETRMGTTTSSVDGVTFPITRDSLAELTDLTKGVTFSSKQAGWYFNLSAAGWRVVTDPSNASGVVSFAATLPNGDACSPAGNSRIYSIDFGLATTVLANNAAYVDSNGLVIDLKVVNVNGKNELVSGNDKGNVEKVPRNRGSSGHGFKRVNWRELPIVQ